VLHPVTVLVAAAAGLATEAATAVAATSKDLLATGSERASPVAPLLLLLPTDIDQGLHAAQQQIQSVPQIAANGCLLRLISITH
jgi:hypothetical protein